MPDTSPFSNIIEEEIFCKISNQVAYDQTTHEKDSSKQVVLVCFLNRNNADTVLYRVRGEEEYL